MKERFRKTISKNIENYADVVVDKAIRIKIRYINIYRSYTFMSILTIF